MRLARILPMAASSSSSKRRAMGMAASDQGDTSAHAMKKPRVRVAPDSSASEDDTDEDHGHDEGDGGEEEEEEEEPDGDGEEESQSYQDPLESDGDGVDEEASAGDMAASEPAAPSTRAAVAGVTVEDADALECGVCFLPLRPPIFQCEVGHVVCAPCRDTLAPAGRCYVCRVAVAGGEYRRCYALERLVDAIRVACHCPGERCGFVGSTAALLDHFAATHNWPCTTNVRAREVFDVRLHDGFNFLVVGGASRHHLVMMNMTREPLGRAITVLRIHPHATGRIQCELSLSHHVVLGDSWGLYRSHYQKSVFDVGCSDLADGLPDAKQCFQFVVPRCVAGDDDEGGTGVRINCEVGHVVCSPCRDKLAPAGRCHVCRVAVAGGEYRRCYALERLVDAIRVACPHAAHGCGATPAYHALDAHRRACPHAPCHCPGERCGLVGSTAALLDHIAATHSWPCTTNVRAGETVSVHLRDGLAFLRVHHQRRRGSATYSDHLIMLNVTREPYGRVVSVLCIRPHAAAEHQVSSPPPPAMQCELLLVSRFGYDGDGGHCRSHYQKSEFLIGCSDLADGLPDREQSFQFMVPRCVVGDDDEGGIQIHVPMSEEEEDDNGGGEEEESQRETAVVEEEEEESTGVHLRRRHYQKSEFPLGCGDLADHKTTFKFVVPRCVVGEILTTTRVASESSWRRWITKVTAWRGRSVASMSQSRRSRAMATRKTTMAARKWRRKMNKAMAKLMVMVMMLQLRWRRVMATTRKVTMAETSLINHLMPLGRAISVLCIHPHAAPAAEMQCELRLHVSRPADDAGGGLCISHYQKSVFHIGYSDLADGVPDRRRRFQFVVPRHVVGGDNEDGVQIRVRIKY
uniref:RING-type E3 ubiquitin transferase n=1 Tax=Oryza barthii TaxID=65489 RepID=A0A0D3G3C8_9ORYZ